MSNYKCCNCGGISSAEEINNKTVAECCINRADRRKYKPIEETKQTDSKWYRCPLCDTNIKRRGWIKQ